MLLPTWGRRDPRLVRDGNAAYHERRVKWASPPSARSPRLVSAGSSMRGPTAARERRRVEPSRDCCRLHAALTPCAPLACFRKMEHALIAPAQVLRPTLASNFTALCANVPNRCSGPRSSSHCSVEYTLACAIGLVPTARCSINRFSSSILVRCTTLPCSQAKIFLPEVFAQLPHRLFNFFGLRRCVRSALQCV